MSGTVTTGSGTAIAVRRRRLESGSVCLKWAGPILVCLAALLQPLQVHAADEVWVARTSGAIDVAADGSVESFRLKESVGTEVDRMIERQISAWRFHPVVEDGQAVPVSALVELRLRGIPEKYGMAVRVAQVNFFEVGAGGESPPGSSRLPPPYYPRKAALVGAMADVSVVVTVDGAGEVVDAQVEEVDLLTSGLMRTAEARRFSEQFEAAVLNAVPDWKIDTRELDSVDGLTRLRVPVSFHLPGMVWGRRQDTGVVRAPAAKDALITDLGANGGLPSRRISLQHSLEPQAGS